MLRLVAVDEVPDPKPVRQDVVQLLEQALEAARAGEIDAIGTIVIHEGEIFTECAGEVADNIPSLWFGTDLLKEALSED